MNVLSWIENRIRDLLNPGEAELNVPPLEGPLKPNDAIDSAAVLAEVPDADNICPTPDGVLFTSGKDLWTLGPESATPSKKRTFDHPVTALASLSVGGCAVGLDGHGVLVVGGPHDGATLVELDGSPLRCVTDLAEIDGALWFTEGSTERPASEWLHDLMGKRCTGRVSRVDVRGLGDGKKPEVVASKLGWPSGVTKAGGGDAIVSVAWEHRLLRLGAARGKGKVAVLWKNIPGYPGRVRPAFEDGAEGAEGGAKEHSGYWLAMFAMRTKLVEFVLQEDEYRMHMMRDIDPRYWVGPALASFDDHWEPLQGGGIKQLGIIKPWAPPRSYGLVVRLDAEAEPVASFHSRAGAHRHGVTSVAQVGGDVVFTSKGNGLALKLAAADRGRQA